jgi:hypothetical protein
MSASLTNQPPPDDVPSVELVFDPSLVDPIFVNTIFVVEDHLGIRELAFGSSDEMQTIIQERPDIWGRVVHVPSLGSTLKSETDVGAPGPLTSEFATADIKELGHEAPYTEMCAPAS